MTFYEYFKEMLGKKGMFPKQAEEVMQRVLAESAKGEDYVLQEMGHRWGHQIDDYPSVLIPMIMLSIDNVALEYIKENCPEAWFRPMFDPEHTLRQELKGVF